MAFFVLFAAVIYPNQAPYLLWLHLLWLHLLWLHTHTHQPCGVLLSHHVIYPNQAFLHPTATVDALAAVLPSGFGAPLAIIRNWT